MLAIHQHKFKPGVQASGLACTTETGGSMKWFHARVCTKKPIDNAPRGSNGWVMRVEGGIMYLVLSYNSFSNGNRHFHQIPETEAGRFLSETGHADNDPFLPAGGGFQALGGF